MSRFFLFFLAAGPLAALLLLPATSVLAQAIKPDKGGASCQLTPECEKHEYDFVPDPGQFFLRWQVRGDLELLTPEDQNPAVICSAGYGKGRITAHYSTFLKEDRCREKCPDTIYHTLDYDVFKQFKAPNPISGPTCVAAGQTVTYAVPPILTDWPHRQAGIGTDSYFWSGFPAGSVLTFSGDSSSVTVQLPPGLLQDFAPTVQVGRCNKAYALQGLVRLDQVLTTDVQVVCGSGGCARLEIRTLPGVMYIVSLPMDWQFTAGSSSTLTGNGQMQTVNFTTSGGWGNVLITATGGCRGSQTTGLSFQVVN